MIRQKLHKHQSEPIVIDLTGPDGNAFVLMAYAERFSRDLGFKSPVDEMREGDYEHTEGEMVELKGADYTLGYALGVLKQIRRILQFRIDA